MVRIILYTLLAIILSSHTTAGTIRHDVADQRYLDYGSTYECVVKLELNIKEKDKNVKANGSAIIIAKHWIVTAAHVAKLTDDMFFVLNGNKFTIDNKFICPGFEIEKNTEDSRDIALCHVKEEIHIKYYPPLYDENTELNKLCGIVGYGITGTGHSGANTSDGKKRAGSNIVDMINGDSLICTMDKNNTTSLEFLVSHGDSGGGLFINQKLAGIHSAVICTDGKPDSTYGDQSVHTRISVYKIWIDTIIKEYDEKK